MIHWQKHGYKKTVTFHTFDTVYIQTDFIRTCLSQDGLPIYWGSSLLSQIAFKLDPLPVIGGIKVGEGNGTIPAVNRSMTDYLFF